MKEHVRSIVPIEVPKEILSNMELKDTSSKKVDEPMKIIEFDNRLETKMEDIMNEEVPQINQPLFSPLIKKDDRE